MSIDDAKAECERWFTYINKQQDKLIAIQKIAADRRSGKTTEDEARRLLQRRDRDVTVYDGANLEKAVRVLLKHVKTT